MEDKTSYAMLNDPEMQEIVESFLIETKEILESLDVDLIKLEKNPDDKELLNQVFRSFHTIKGTSGFLGLDKIPKVTHRCEDILNKLRKGEVSLNNKIMDGIFLSHDNLKSLLASVENSKNEDIDIENTLKILNELIKDIDSGKSDELIIEKKDLSEQLADHENLEKINSSVAETKKDVQSEQQNKLSSPEKKEDNTIRVDIKRLDKLLNIASELVLGRNMLLQVNQDIANEFEGTKISRDLAEAAKQIDLMTNELQMTVMKTRMIKIGKIFNRFPRLVRDLSKETGKKVKLIIKGDETELDKTLIEEIYDPLVHLIRNAVDHGIELPEVRKSKGKDETGTIVLSAEHEGNNVLITIEDDGKGIDPDFIKEKAISKGLISRERAAELSKHEANNLIFLPGFSTAEKVTNVSGRGVGMDVVKTNVTKLRGIINIESEKEIGLKFIVKLPLTLAIIPGMIVKVGSETVVIPLNSVIEVVKVYTKDIHKINQQEVIRLRDSVIPVLSIDDLFLVNSNGNNVDREQQYFVVVGIAEKQYGIKVDGLIGQKEVVIKPLGNYLGNIEGIAGSTIMGDGTVVVILDIAEILNRLKEHAEV